MRRFLPSTKDPITNQPAWYWNLVTDGIEGGNPTETNVLKIIDPIVITTPNFPADVPTRYMITLPGVPDYSGAFNPDSGRQWTVQIKRGVSFVDFVLVAQDVELTTNTCKIFSGASENNALIEFHDGSVQADDFIHFNGFFKNTVLHSSDANAMIKGATSFIIASSDSDDNSKIQADFILETPDDVGEIINTIVNGFDSIYGGSVLFMAGTYIQSTMITLTNNIKLYGQNKMSKIVRGSDELVTQIFLNGNYNIIEGLYLDGNEEIEQDNEAGISIKGSNNLIQNNIITNILGDIVGYAVFQEPGIAGLNNRILNNDFLNCTTGLYFASASAGSINNEITGNYFSDISGNAIEIARFGHIISNNKFINNGGDDINCNDITIVTGNYCTSPIVCDVGNIISNNVFTTITVSGVDNVINNNKGTTITLNGNDSIAIGNIASVVDNGSGNVVSPNN